MSRKRKVKRKKHYTRDMIEYIRLSNVMDEIGKSFRSICINPSVKGYIANEKYIASGTIDESFGLNIVK